MAVLSIIAVILQPNMLLVKGNSTKTCFPPLAATKSELGWYPYVDGCGLPCENVLFTEADHAHAHVFIAVAGSLCSFCTLFTVVSAAYIISPVFLLFYNILCLLLTFLPQYSLQISSVLIERVAS